MTALLDDLRVMIAQDGPISLERFMALALGHPVHGYYMTRDPFGTAGDFTTAPEISQMFGELLGLWAAEVWDGMGRPDPVVLAELGPGRGTLMADVLRAARAMPPFRAAVHPHLVETSAALRAIQGRTLAVHGVDPAWHDTVATLPDGPALVLANEFFDALPIRQYVRVTRGWCERLVGLDATGALAFGLAAEADPHVRMPAQEGAVLEIGPTALQIARDLAARIFAQGGALLAIDYGHGTTGFADTLQAVRQHRGVDPLADPGEADLTAHVDFAALGRTAVAQSARVYGPKAQGAFLRSLGLAQRAAALVRAASREQAGRIRAAETRLAGPHPGMGDLFKVMAVTHPDMPVPPGFATEFRP